MIQRALVVLLAALMIQISASGTAMAATVIRGGANGLNGADGADGVPGEAGGDGGDAPATVTAIAEDAFQRNIAEATGGSGGPGGDGGDATLGSGANGGNGGAGGMGGDAVAIATTLGLDLVRAVATGGAPGSFGQGGNGSDPGVDGMRGSNVGVTSGSAIATATIDRSSAIIGQFSEIQGDAIAVGTNATATVIGEVRGNPNDLTAIHRLEAYADGGAGDTTAAASGMANHGILDVTATAEVRFTNDGPRQVTATASGVHAGSGVLNVTANARLLNLSVTAPGMVNPTAFGTANLSASGVATNGADVNVLASVFGGSDDTDLRNTVSGSTSGRLTLSQIATKTRGQIGATGPVLGRGAIRTRLVAENTGGGDLEINIDAQASRMLGDSLNGGDVILGDVRGVSTAGANVDINVSARGYRIRQEQLDAPGSPSRIEGVSNGGDVAIAATFRSGLGAEPGTLVGTVFVAESAQSVAIDNGVRGETTGRLTLNQDVKAEQGRDIPDFFFPGSIPPGTTFRAGDGGDAFNRIAQSGSFEFLSIQGTSTSGNGGRSRRFGIGANAGSTTTILEGENDAGGVIVVGNAISFNGASSRSQTGNGGDATVDFRAMTSGDGNAIRVGSEVENERILNEFGLRIGTLNHGARAGDAGGAVFFMGAFVTEEFGRGGNADSRSEGLATGDSEVLVYDYATGGDSDGQGGNANSSARAEGGGAARVLAQSRARGGVGLERAGDSLSLAHAIGFGEVQANSSALAFDFGGIGPTTRATSVVDLVGTSGNAVAEAEARTFPSGSLRAMMQRATSNSARFEVAVGDGIELFVPSTVNTGSAFLTGTPLQADVDTFTSGNAAIGEIFASTPTARIAMLGQWSARGDDTGSSTQLVELDIELSQPDDQSQLALVFSEVDAAGGGFESMRFRIEVFGELFGDEMIFSDLDDATTYLSSVFLLGEAFMGQSTGPGIRAIFDVTLGAGQSISYGLAAVVVPEPSAALLIGLGLLFFVTTRNRAAFAA